MGTYNKVMLIGELTCDPEMESTFSGLSLTRFKMAVTRPGEDDVKSFRCVATGRHAEVIEENAHKGSSMLVDGHIIIDGRLNGDCSMPRVEIEVADFQFLRGRGSR